MTLLDFALPEFTRVSWASDAAYAAWSSRLHRITQAWLELEWLSVAEGLRPCGILSGHASGSPEYGARWANRGLATLPSEGAGDGTVVGSLENLAQFGAAYDRNAHAEVARLLGVPSCCHELYRRAWVEEGWFDTTWPMACASVESPAPEQVLTIDGPWQANILWRWMGIRAVPHLPCAARCPATERIGRGFIELARGAGYGLEMEWLEEVLSWPAEWSALHGIAEIKTPVLKATTRTDATAEKLVVRRLGDRYPAEGARGVAFPYRQEATPILGRSAGFRRGIENPIVPALALEPWLASDNGFDSVEAMLRAHQPIVRLVRETLGGRAGSVLDLGCGNGALLRQLRHVNLNLEVFGIDSEPERIAHARKLLPEIAANFRCGDIFELELPRPKGLSFSAVLLMPGRLLEAGEERALRLLRRLEGRCERLLVYAYGDWLTRFRDLEGLVTATPGLVSGEFRGARAAFVEVDLPCRPIHPAP